ISKRDWSSDVCSSDLSFPKVFWSVSVRHQEEAIMHPTRRTTLAGLGLSLPVLAGLSACGGGKKPAGGAGSPSSLCGWALTRAKADTYQASFDAWTEDPLDDSFAVKFFANDSDKEKIRTAIGSGNAPTLVFNCAGGPLDDSVANHSVIDLTSKVDDVLSRTIESINTVGEI